MNKVNRELERGARLAELQALRASFPLSEAALQQMFEMLGERLAKEDCDNTLRLTSAWLDARGYEEGPVLAWMKEHGGTCDCEVLFNVEEYVHEVRGG
jgi:hypothetical protein